MSANSYHSSELHVRPDPDPKKAPAKSAHTVELVNHVSEAGELTPTFLKGNKHGDPLASARETSFARLAGLFMSRYLTPKQHLVLDENNKVVGTAVDHVCLSIAQRDGNAVFMKANYSAFTEEGEETLTFVEVARDEEKEEKEEKTSPIKHPAESIPFRFLGDMEGGFFAYLKEQHDAKNLVINVEALASDTVIPYLLEEDDLHRNNIGFYVIKKEGKPHVVFFKIDHDLMFSESLTSYTDCRVQSWTNYRNFQVTARDLRDFPDLKDSNNHYWPTRERLGIPGDKKLYSHAGDREAFKALKDDPDFQRYKWKSFLKSILVPYQLTHACLSLDLNGSGYQSEINLISQATSERLAALKAVLFSTPEFFHYFNNIDGRGSVDLEANIEELTAQVMDLQGLSENTKTDIIRKIREQAESLKKLALNPDVNAQNVQYNTCATKPLHAAIYMQEYRFEKTDHYTVDPDTKTKMIHTVNFANKLPIEVAADWARNFRSDSEAAAEGLKKEYEPGSERINPSKDPFLVIKSLLEHGSVLPKHVATFLKERNIDIKTYQFNSEYLDGEINNYEELKERITFIGIDNNLTLKTQKTLTVRVVEKFITKLTQEELMQFKRDLNGGRKGDKQQEPKPEFLFISQLRNSIWLVRLLFGLYGKTVTKNELNKLIAKHDKTPSFFSWESLCLFFRPRPEKPQSAACGLSSSPGEEGYDTATGDTQATARKEDPMTEEGYPEEGCAIEPTKATSVEETSSSSCLTS